MLVVYSLSPGPAVIADTLPEVAPNKNEPFVQSGVDKFYSGRAGRIRIAASITAPPKVETHSAGKASHRQQMQLAPLPSPQR